MQKLRKAFVISVMSFTVLSMSMLAVPFQVDAAAVAGDLIKMDGLASVYYYAGDGKRYVFPNETTYFSWYSDFSGVKTISQAELEGIDLGKNVTVRPGTRLVKITTNPNVYAVEPGGKLVKIPDEATAKALFGDMWAKRVSDVPDAFFNNYTITGEVAVATAYPEGSLVKFGTAADVFYIAADGKARKIADEAAFAANRFKFSNVITSTLAMPTAGEDITAMVSTLTDTSSGAGGQAGAGTGMTVAISGDTPAAGNVPGNSPVDFLKFNLTAANDGDVMINSIKIKAFDLGNPVNIDSVTILDSGVKQGTSKNVNSDKEAVFNFSTPIKVAAGTTKTLTVRATIAATTGNYALGINSASDIGTNGAVVSGSFPLIGNTKAAVDGSTSVGSVTLSDPTLNQSAGADFGEDNILLAGFDLAVANESVIWESATFKNLGTNDVDIVDNMRIEVAGKIIAEGVKLNGKYATFNMGNLVIDKGDSVNVEVYGDAGVGSANNTINFAIEGASDFSFVGQGTGYGVVAVGFDLFDAATEGVKVTLSASDFTIDMDKATTPARDVRADNDNVVLATVKMTSNGENATIDSITDVASSSFYISGTSLESGDIENVELYDTNSGTIYDIAATYRPALPGWTLSLTDEISFTKGVTKTFQVRADLNSAIDDNDTLQVVMANSAFTITGESSSADLDITPSSVSSAVATVKASSLTWTTTALTAKTVVSQASGVTIYQASAKAGASSDVTLSSVRIDADDSVTADTFTDVNFATIDLYIDNKLAKANSKIVNDGADTAYVNFTSLIDSARTIKAGATVNVEVRATFGSTFNPTGAMALELAALGNVTARDIDNNTFDITAANAGTNSRTVTLAANGTLKVELKTTDQKANNDTYILAGSATKANSYLGELVFTTANEPVKVKTLVLGQTKTATDADILAVQLFDKDGVMVAQEGVDAYGNVYFDAFNKEFAADKSTSLFIGVVAKSINAEGDAQGTATHGANIQFNLASTTQLAELDLAANKAVTAQGVNSGVAINLTQAVTNDPVADKYENATTTTRTTTITGSVLTSITNAMVDGSLTGGAGKVIAKYKFVFDNGNNRTSTNEVLKAQLVELKLTLATSSAVVTGIEAYIDGDSANKIAAANAVGNVVTLNLDEATTGLALDGLVDGEVTLVVTGNIAIASAAVNGSVSTEIDNLTGGDFDYDGNNGTATDFTDPRLDYTDVTGATLSL
jgi:hypothetical protein